MENLKAARELLEDLADREDEFREAYLYSRDLDDLLHEAVDSACPIYYHEMASALDSDTSLAHVDDHGLLPPDPSVWDILSISIYERLSAVAYEWRAEREPEWDEWEEEEEDEEDEEEHATA